MKHEVKQLVINALMNNSDPEILTARLALILSDKHIDVLATGVATSITSYNDKTLMALVSKRNSNVIPCATITHVRLTGELRTEVEVEGYFIAEFFAESEKKAAELATKDHIGSWCGWRDKKTDSHQWPFKGRYEFSVRVPIDDAINAKAITVKMV